MENKDDLLPHNRNYFLLGGCLTFIFTLVILSLVVQNLQRQEAEKPVIQELSVVEDKNNNNNDNNQITRYSQDSDQDGIPNFIEDEAGLDKFKSEYFFCESTNQKCSEPINSTKYIFSILVDASTSMNLPAEKEISKIDLLKTDLTTFTDSNELNRDYINSSIRSFGNTGQRGNLPDSQSCVSSFKITDFGEEILDTTFDSYVANGKSPLIFALEQAEKDFTDPNAQKIIILITDGVDECNPSSLKNAFSGILSRGIVKKINTVSFYTPSYEEGILKDATESNSGYFIRASTITNTLQNIIVDNVTKNSCLYTDQQKLNRCISGNFDKALNVLNSKINSQTSQAESRKIREINSEINFGIQKYTSTQNNEIINSGKEFIKFEIPRNKRSRSR